MKFEPNNHSIKSLGGEGILISKDLEDFSKAQKRIWELMKDEKWHSASEIIAISLQRSGLRRLREMRSNKILIQSKRMENRDFYYKLSFDETTPEQQELKLTP